MCDFKPLFLISINKLIKVDYKICDWSVLPSEKKPIYAIGCP